MCLCVCVRDVRMYTVCVYVAMAQFHATPTHLLLNDGVSLTLVAAILVPRVIIGVADGREYLLEACVARHLMH